MIDIPIALEIVPIHLAFMPITGAFLAVEKDAQTALIQKAAEKLDA